MKFPARRWLGVISLAMLWGCARAPESYPIPEQHRSFRQTRATANEFVNASDVYADRYFVRDIQSSGEWRWTGARPELRFVLDSVQNRKLFCEFEINETTFKDTGPVTISFFVNEHLLERVRYDTPGGKTFQAPVPSGWLQKGRETRVEARVENPWRAGDGIYLGILLKRAGFIE